MIVIDEFDVDKKDSLVVNRALISLEKTNSRAESPLPCSQQN